MAFRDRRQFILAAGLFWLPMVGCGPTISNEAHSIGPPVDPSTVRKQSTKESFDQIKEDVADFARSKPQQKRPARTGPDR